MGCGSSSNVASSKKNVHDTQPQQLRHVQDSIPNPPDPHPSPPPPEWVQSFQTDEATSVMPIPSPSHNDGGGGGSGSRPGDQTSSSGGGGACERQAHSQAQPTKASFPSHRHGFGAKSSFDTVVPRGGSVLAIEGSCVRNVLFNNNDDEGDALTEEGFLPAVVVTARKGNDEDASLGGAEDETLQPLDLRPSVASQAPSFQSSGSQWMVASSNMTLDSGNVSSDDGGGSFGSSRIKRSSLRGSSGRLPVEGPPRRRKRYADAHGDNDSLCSPPVRRATQEPPQPPSSSLLRRPMSFRLDEEEKGSDQKAIMSLSSPSQAAGDDSHNNAASGGAPRGEREQTAAAPPSSFTLYGAGHRKVPFSSPLSECSSTMARIDQTRFVSSEDPTMIRSTDSVVPPRGDDA